MSFIHRFTELTREQLSALPPDLTAFLFPVGGLEQHGEVLPLGTKISQAEKIIDDLATECARTMPHFHFVKMPTLPLMVDGYTSKVAFPVRAHVLRDALVDICEHLKRLGFKNFAAWSTHRTPRTLTAIEDAGRIVTKRNKALLVSLSSLDVSVKEMLNSPLVALPTEHAGYYDHCLAKINPPITVATPQANLARLYSYFTHQLDGTWSSKFAPQSQDTAQSAHQQAIARVALLMKPLLESGQGRTLFQSPYRHFPFNHSFFKAYLIAAIFFVLMLFWTLMSLKDVFE